MGFSNKSIGSDFEKKFCSWLAGIGCWVHFVAPDNRGAQPFDVIAVKDGFAEAIDCKTSVRPIFSIDRLEDNQKYAFERWMACGNSSPVIAVLYDDRLYIIDYTRLKERGKIDLREETARKDWR